MYIYHLWFSWRGDTKRYTRPRYTGLQRYGSLYKTASVTPSGFTYKVARGAGTVRHSVAAVFSRCPQHVSLYGLKYRKIFTRCKLGDTCHCSLCAAALLARWGPVHIISCTHSWASWRYCLVRYVTVLSGKRSLADTWVVKTMQDLICESHHLNRGQHFESLARRTQLMTRKSWCRM